MKRAGFQLAARFKDSGAQAGTLAPGSGEAERVRVEAQSGVQYAGQKKAGSSVGAADADAVDDRVDRAGPRRAGDLSRRGQCGRRQRKRRWRFRVHGDRRIGAASVTRRFGVGSAGTVAVRACSLPPASDALLPASIHR